MWAVKPSHGRSSRTTQPRGTGEDAGPLAATAGMENSVRARARRLGAMVGCGLSFRRRLGAMVGRAVTLQGRLGAPGRVSLQHRGEHDTRHRCSDQERIRRRLLRAALRQGRQRSPHTGSLGSRKPVGSWAWHTWPWKLPAHLRYGLPYHRRQCAVQVSRMHGFQNARRRTKSPPSP